MNWLVLAVVGGAAAWFEYNYQRSRRRRPSTTDHESSGGSLVPETAHVEQAGDAPSISPGSENDKKLNTA
ncbi:MAG TPA: hypothetical protein VL240_14385 [Candidatus Binatia bacterium]|nr:hypothetical protein [Candidatus Binatia bacterium]